MGPGDGIQNQRLLDLPTTLETAEHTNKQLLSSLNSVNQLRKSNFLEQSKLTLIHNYSKYKKKKNQDSNLIFPTVYYFVTF